jgi:hypothetical protein
MQNRDISTSKHEAMTADINNIVKRAKAVGINPSKIIHEILTTVRNVQYSEEGVCTDADVVHKWRALFENIQQVMKKYGIYETDIEIGSYHDPDVMNGYTEVKLMLSSHGNLYQEDHDGQACPIEFSKYWLAVLHDTKQILYNLIGTLIEVTEKNKAKIKKIEDSALEFINDLSQTQQTQAQDSI